MKLISNDCVNCRRTVGYLVPKALQIPTLCIICVSDKEVMKEWGHKLARNEKPILEVIRDYRDALSIRINEPLTPKEQTK